MIVSHFIISRSTLFIATLCIASFAMADVDIETNNIGTETENSVKIEIPSTDTVAELQDIAQAEKAVYEAPIAERPVEVAAVNDTLPQILTIEELEYEVVAEVQPLAVVTEESAPAVINVEQRVELVLDTDSKPAVITIEQSVAAAPATKTSSEAIVIEQSIDVASAPVAIMAEPQAPDVGLIAENSHQVTDTVPNIETVPSAVAVEQQADAAVAQAMVVEPAIEQLAELESIQELSTDLENNTTWIQWLQTQEGRKYGIGAIAVVTILGVTYVLYKNRVPQRIYGYVANNPIKTVVSTACVLGIAAFVAHQQGITLDGIKKKLY